MSHATINFNQQLFDLNLGIGVIAWIAGSADKIPEKMESRTTQEHSQEKTQCPFHIRTRYKFKQHNKFAFLCHLIPKISCLSG